MPSSFVSRYKNTEFFIRIRFYCTLQWLFPAERKLQNDKISTADQQINRAFNGFSYIYLPLSFIEVIKCTGEFLPHQRKFVDGKRGRVQGGPHAMNLTKINFMHTIVYDFFFTKQTSCLIQNNLMHATYVLSSSLTRNIEVKQIT